LLVIGRSFFLSAKCQKGKIHIIVKGNVGKQSGGYMNFTISLFFKEGRYKYIFTDFSHEGENYYVGRTLVKVNSAGPFEIVEQKGAWSGNFFAYRDNWTYAKEQTNEAILNLINSLKENMTISVIEESW
jgi:hypothetical protein